MNRINWIDVARGIGIILVIQGHSLGAHSYRHFIYAFHMPLFFFISGLVFDYKKYNFRQTFKKSVKGILVPYVLFSLLSIVLWPLQIGNFEWTPYFIGKQLLGIIYANSQTLDFNLVLWFLPCLFVAKILFAFLSEKIKNTLALAVFLIGFSLLGYFAFLYFPDLTLPFGIESAVTAVVFFGLGSIVRTNYYERLNKVNRKKLFYVLFIAISAVLISAALNFSLYGRQIDIRLNNLGNYFLFYLGALSGIITTVIISIFINKNRVLEYLGKYALVLFVLHNIVLFFIGKFLLLFISAEFLSKNRDYYLSPFLTIAAICIILGLTFIYKKALFFVKTR